MIDPPMPRKTDSRIRSGTDLNPHASLSSTLGPYNCPIMASQRDLQQRSCQLKEMDWDMHREICTATTSHDEFLSAQLRVPSQALLPLHGEVSSAATWQTQCRRLWPHSSVPKMDKQYPSWKHWSQTNEFVEAFLGARLQWKAHQQ